MPDTQKSKPSLFIVLVTALFLGAVGTHLATLDVWVKTRQIEYFSSSSAAFLLFICTGLITTAGIAAAIAVRHQGYKSFTFVLSTAALIVSLHSSTVISSAFISDIPQNIHYRDRQDYPLSSSVRLLLRTALEHPEPAIREQSILTLGRYVESEFRKSSTNPAILTDPEISLVIAVALRDPAPGVQTAARSVRDSLGSSANIIIPPASR